MMFRARTLIGSIFVWAMAATAVAVSGPLAAQAQVASGGVIRAIAVEGNQRLEPATVASYLTVGPGDPFDPARLDTSLTVLFGTGLFADVAFERRGDILVVRVAENPIINRVEFEGNRAIDDEDLSKEIQAQPRAIFTRARVQADVQRMVDLYRKRGRFAAQVTPKVVEQPQNRVDLIFEISEGPTTDVRRINFIGNEAYSDRKLRGVVLTEESRFWKFFTSNDNYDPDRLEYDRELLRQYYTDRGYADFRVTSAVAELTPDQKDFFITYVLDEGQPYRFGEISVTSSLAKLDEGALLKIVPIKEGTVYKGSQIQETIEALTFAAGASGYAFVQVRPQIERDREGRTISINFEVEEGPRVYIERIDIVGNARTVDRVIRREVQLVEGDAFNRVLLDRSRNRVRALGYFKDVTVTEQPGTADDRTIVEVAVEEQPTGEISFGAGFSSVDAFLVDLSITERNLRGRGQFLRFRISASSTRSIVDIRFTEPRFMGRNVAAGFDLFNTRQDFIDEAGFETNSVGGSLRAGFPVSENSSMGLRYTLRQDDVKTFAGASSAVSAQAGDRLTSVLGYTYRWDRRNDPIEPTRGFDLTFSQDFAGVGGDVKFLRSEFDAAWYRGIYKDFVATLSMSTGYVYDYADEGVLISDRFFKGGATMRGFDTAGMGPRVVTYAVDPDTQTTDFTVVRKGDALGGQLFAIGTAEMSFPLGLPEQYGIKGSLFTEVGTLGIIDDATKSAMFTNANPNEVTVIRDGLSLRASAGVSIFWKSPFGPVRFDFSEVLAREDYDRTESFRFSTSTQF